MKAGFIGLGIMGRPMAKNLLKAGAKENKKKKSLDEMDTTTFLDDQTNFLTS